MNDVSYSQTHWWIDLKRKSRANVTLAAVTENGRYLKINGKHVCGNEFTDREARNACRYAILCNGLIHQFLLKLDNTTAYCWKTPAVIPLCSTSSDFQSRLL